MDKFQEDLTNKINKFRIERNWVKYHTPKDVAMNLSIESNELLQLFLWKSEDEIDKNKLKDEIGDVLYSLLLICNQFNIDLKTAFEDKMIKNEQKYPINKFYGSNKKHNE